MFEVDINYLAVLAAAVVSMIVGWLWYAPFVFGKLLARLTGEDCSEKKGAAASFLAAFAASCVTALLLAYFIELTAVADVIEAAIMAGAVWLGFTAMTLISAVIWKKMSFGVFLIKSGYYLVSYILMSAVITLITYR